MKRITVDLTKASTETLDLTDKLNPRVGDSQLAVPLHVIYGTDDSGNEEPVDMRNKDIEFLSQDTNKNDIYVSGTVTTDSKGDDPYSGNVTFVFPEGTFKVAGTYDVDKTMFRIINKTDKTVLSTVNVKLNVLEGGGSDYNFDPKKTSYNSRLEDMLKLAQSQLKDKIANTEQEAQAALNDAKQKAAGIIKDASDQAQALLDDIKQTNSEAKGNVAGDTAATAKQAKQLANDNSGKIHDLQGEVGDARGRFMTLSDRENKQDFDIDRKEDKANANANYAAQDLRNDRQDAELAKKANVSFITDYLSKMHLQPEAFENADALKAKYPAGKAGIMVAADTGHMWIWVNDEWKDCGAYQSAGYPEVDEARVGAKSLGGKNYANLSEAIHRQIDGLSNLGNQAFSYPVTGLIGQQVSLQSEYEVGAKSGAILKVKFDLDDEASDLSVIQVYANGTWFASIERQNFGKWVKYKLDKDVGALGLVIPADKFSSNFTGKINFQVITTPVSDLQKGLEQLSYYEIPVSPSTTQDELKPEYIDGIDLNKDSKVYVRLKTDAKGSAVKNYQLIANGKILMSFNDLNTWHEVTLTSDTTSLGFKAYKSSVVQDFDGTFQIIGNILNNIYQEIDSSRKEFRHSLSNLLSLSLKISASPDASDEKTVAVKDLSLPKGSKIKVKFATEVNPAFVEAYQVYANGKFLISFQDVNTWHKIILPNDTVSLGYAFYDKRMHGTVTGSLQIIGGAFNDLYNSIISDTEDRLNDQLTSAEIEQLNVKEKQINAINDGITHGISFVFMTDPHFPDNDLLSKPSMKHILDHTSIPFVICGGDFPGAFGSKDDVMAARDKILNYQNYIGKGKFFSIQGNHDFTIRQSPTNSTGYTAGNSLVYNTLVRQNEFYLPSIRAGKEYYYIDIPSQNTRIFMLNSMDGNPEAENTDSWGTQYTISQAQADWLVEKAKEKSGWKFIFVCHVPCDSNLDGYHPNEEYFHKVAAAINGKQQLAFHAQNINEDADFTDTTNEVVTILAGHNHADQSSAKDGVLSITTTSDARYGDGGWERPQKTYSSQAFDIVSINYDDKMIRTTRIGGGQDRVFSYESSDQGEKINSLKLRPIESLTVGSKTNCIVDMSTPLVAQPIKWSNRCFTWATSDSAVVDVDRFGAITANKAGTAKITVSTKDGRYSDQCSVTVN